MEVLPDETIHTIVSVKPKSNGEIRVRVVRTNKNFVNNLWKMTFWPQLCHSSPSEYWFLFACVIGICIQLMVKVLSECYVLNNGERIFVNVPLF